MRELVASSPPQAPLDVDAASEGVGHLRPQGATTPLNDCKGIRYRRNGRASGDDAENFIIAT